MDDKHKTKPQLIGELEELRQRVGQMDKAESPQPNHHPRFLAWADSAASAIFIFQDSAFRYTNPAMSRLTGYTAEELLATNIWSLIHPSFRELIRERVSAWRRGEAVPARSEFKILTKSGETRWINADSTFVEFDGSLAALTIAFDSTDHKVAEEALNASEERYRSIVETAQEGIWMVDAEANTTYVNHHLAEMFGYTRDAMLGRSVFDFVDDAAHQEAGWLLERGRQGIKGHHDFRFLRKDGSDLWTIVSTTPLFDGGGRFAGGLAMLVDVTERKRAEQALRESQSRLHAILDNCPAMIFLKDLDGRYLQVNRQFERTFNLTPEQVLGRTDDELFPPELTAAFRATDRSVLEAGGSLEFEEQAVYADGPHAYIVHKFPLHDAARNVYAVGGISTDITARKRAEDDLRKQKETLQKIFDHIPVMIAFIDSGGKMKLLNRAWEQILGWTFEEAQGLDMFAEMYPDGEYRRYVLGFVEKATGEWGDFTTRVRDGSVLDTSWANVRLSDDTSIGIGQDITERKRADDLLRRRTAQLAALHEIEMEISSESDLSRILEVVTRRAAELLDAFHCGTFIRERDEAALTLVAPLESKFIGLRLEGAEGLAGRALITGEAQAVDDYSKWPGRARVFDAEGLGPAVDDYSKRPGRAHVIDAEGFGPALAAPLKWQQTVIGAIALSRKRGEKPFTGEDSRLLEQLAAEAAIAIHQATLFNEVQESQRRLQVLSHRLIDAQEAERKRLARELHDQIGQALTAVQISLQALQSSCDGTSASALDDCLTIIDDALEQVHDLSLDLRPSLLDDLGLVAALRWYVDRVASRAGLIGRFYADPIEVRLAPEIETACFRIAQEALTNVLRHAHASGVSVELRQYDSCLKLVIRDNGVGLDVAEALSRTDSQVSLGLQGMLERAAALAGQVVINSGEGRGTEVRASFPLKP